MRYNGKSWNKKYRYKISVIIYNSFVRNENSLHKIRHMTYFIFTQFPILHSIPIGLAWRKWISDETCCESKWQVVLSIIKVVLTVSKYCVLLLCIRHRNSKLKTFGLSPFILWCYRYNLPDTHTTLLRTFPLLNRKQATCNFLSPELEVTWRAVAIIIRVISLFPYLRICGTSLSSIHYNQSRRVYINQRHEYIRLIWI